MTSALFRYVEQFQGGAPWGAVLDAGAGVNSATWLAGLETERWTGVTAAPAHAAQVRTRLQGRMRPQDRLVVGNWMDEALLGGERFDAVIADYLLGAVEGFGPYFQSQLFARLRRHVGGRLYIIGLDPYIVGPAGTPAERVTRAIGRLRDCCLLLADETLYREFPAEWAARRLQEDGYRVLTVRRFGNRYRPAWVEGQLNMALQRLPRIPDPELRAALAARIGALRQEALELCAREDGLRSGYDYVIAAEPGG